jgi:HSP20 family molecular chaperone IbpA
LVGEVRFHTIPVSCVFRNNEKYAIEVELPGVKKKDVEFTMTPSSFCVSGRREDLEY